MMRAVGIAVLSVMLAGLAAAASAAVSPGFDHFYNLEYDQALSDFERETVARPDDPTAWNHLAQCILYREMYHNGALETELFGGTNPFFRRQKLAMAPDAENDFSGAINRVIERSQSILAGNPKDPAALYA